MKHYIGEELRYAPLLFCGYPHMSEVFPESESGRSAGEELRFSEYQKTPVRE